MLKHLNPKPGAAFTLRQHSLCRARHHRRSQGRRRIRRPAGRRLDAEHLHQPALSRDVPRQESPIPKAREFLKRKIQSAQWLIDAIEQRRSTLIKVTRAIIQHQKAFLDKGPEHIEPLKMQQIADQVGVHVTTVSRAVDDKWVQTPRGIFPLKRFFGGGTHTATGEEVAWETIKQKLLEIIGNEDKANPLSDEDLVDKLQRVGLSGGAADGDEVSQDAEHPVVAAAQGVVLVVGSHHAGRAIARCAARHRAAGPADLGALADLRSGVFRELAALSAPLCLGRHQAGVSRRFPPVHRRPDRLARLRVPGHLCHRPNPRRHGRRSLRRHASSWAR